MLTNLIIDFILITHLKKITYLSEFTLNSKPKSKRNNNDPELFVSSVDDR